MNVGTLPREMCYRAQREAVPLCIVFMTTLLAKAGALLPGFSIDDYPFMDSAKTLAPLLLKRGRVGQWLFLKAAIALQLEPNSAHIFYAVLSIAAYGVIGLAIVHFWRVRDTGWWSIAAAVVIANHPYTSEIFTFRIGLPVAALVMVLLTLILLLIARGSPWFMPGTAMFAAALSVSPISLHYGLMIACIGFAIEATRSVVGPEAVPQSGLGGNVTCWRLVSGRSARLLAVVVSGAMVYVTIGLLLWHALGIDTQYFRFLGPADIPSRLRTAVPFLAATFLGPNVLIPRAANLALATVVALGLLGLFWTWCRGAQWWQGALGWAAVVALLGFGLLWSLGLSLILRAYWPVPRHMAHVGILWGGCIVLAAAAVRGGPLRGALAVSVVVIVLSFVGASEQILDDQTRLNKRDALVASRIVARLERHAGFPAVRRVVIVGKRGSYPVGPLKSQWGDMNISAFGASWSRVRILREISGYDLRESKVPEERASAEADCAKTAPWPARGSVRVEGEVATICLGP
jgi:hypothetical protein